MSKDKKSVSRRKKSEPGVSIIPLGGCGEIGKNMTAIETEQDTLVIDAGLMFPDEEMFGVDIIIPDFTYLKKKASQIRGIVLTHGHEDHIGALPYVLSQINCPVYGTRLTLGLVKNKLAEHPHLPPVKLIQIKPRDRINIGESFEVEFFRVSHSIVDGVGLGIHTPAGLIVHTGDFKVDQTPIDGEVIDFHKIAELGNSGVLLLMSDSTNVEREGYSRSEREVGDYLEEIFSEAQRRIMVATFASNVHRIKQVITAAVNHKRKVTITGMSMIKTVEMATELGYLNFPKGTIIPFERIKKMPANKVVVITTGSQGEPMSALSRMATKSHKQIKIQPQDTVVISARVIPGNESTIARTINNLFKLGAEVVYEKVSDVHVSGHASREELKLMLNLVRPRFFVPIHGEYRHLVHHAQLAEKVNIPKENIFILDNGQRLNLTKDKARITGSVQSGIIMVDGKGVGDVGSVVLRDRQHLAQDGMVIVILAVDKLSGKFISDPEIISRGFVYLRRSDELMYQAKTKVTAIVAELTKKTPPDHGEIKSSLRDALRKFFYEETERRPMILPVIIEV
ncbi:MAG: ribonuclease J [bacterium]